MIYTIAGGAIAFVAALAWLVWYANRLGRETGAADTKAELANEEAENAKRVGQVLADPRSTGDTVDRLRKTTF